MDSPRRQRSISLCQPHSTTRHPSPVGVPTRLPHALGCRPSATGGQGATLSTFPLVPLTRGPTCTQAIDPGISRSTLTPADTSRPSRSSGHFPDFPWSGSPCLAHGSPLHGDRRGKQYNHNRNLTADHSHPNTPTVRRRKQRRTNKTGRAWRQPKHHQPEPENAGWQAAQKTTTQAQHHHNTVTAAVTALNLYINVIRISMIFRCTLVQ